MRLCKTLSLCSFIKIARASASSEILDLILFGLVPTSSLLTPVRKFLRFFPPKGGKLLFSFLKISFFQSANALALSSSEISLSAKNSLHDDEDASISR